jgi:protease-4
VAENRSRGIVGIFVLIGALFVIFLIFAFYTISNLKDATKLSGSNGKDSPIAVVEVEGVIMQSKPTIKKLLKAEEDKKIKAIIVRVNSPGGAVGPTQEIYEEIRRIDKDIKPVYASFGTVAASGGYYIGAACRRIYTNSGALTGSIGVIMNFMNLSKLYDWAKVKPETIKAGKYKDIGSAARAMTDEERLLLTEMSESVHEQFIMDIFKVREKKIKGGIQALREYAQGQIFSGQGAVNRGLADEIAGLWETGRRIHKELNIKEDFGLKFIKLKKKLTFMEVLEGIEESVEDFKYGVISHDVPLLMYKK